jgi:hypothetical protein
MRTLVAAVVAATLQAATVHGAPVGSATVTARWPADEARQGVAVDATAFYAIDDAAIGKYDKNTGRKLAEWHAGASGAVVHLNGGVVVDGELLCAHSNYPAVPMRSSIEIFDAATLRRLRRRDLGGGRGSATWVDRHDGSWWVGFAHYSGRGGERGRGSERTTLRRFDLEWNELGSWRFPPAVVASWRGMSNSGGVWRGRRLYTTGHDEPRIHVLELPASGDVLELVGTIAIESAGQGIALDAGADLLYSVQRATRHVIVSRLP